MPPRDLCTIGWKITRNPDIGKRIRHSRFMDKYRREKGLGFVKAVVKTGATIAINFIPIPIVKDAVAIAFDTEVRVARRKYVEYKRKHAGSDGEAEVKWGWKDIDLSAFDRYRWKIWHAHKGLVDAVQYLQEHKDDTATLCNDVVHAWARYFYFFKRMERFEEELEAIQTLIKKTKKWMDEVEGAVRKQDFFSIISEYEYTARSTDPNDDDPLVEAEDYHYYCDPKYCAHKHRRLTVLGPGDRKWVGAVGDVVSEVWDTVVADSVSDLPGNTNIFTG